MRKVRKGSQFELYQGNGTRASPEHKSFGRLSCDAVF